MTARIPIPKSSMPHLLRALNDLLESKISAVVSASGDGFSEEDIRALAPTSAEYSALFKPETAARKTKTKDPNKPKKPKTGFLIYTHSAETREAFKDANPEQWDESKKDGAGGPKKITDLTKWASSNWKELSEEGRKPYEDQAAELSTEYKAAMEAYEPTEVVAVEEDAPPAPDGWKGPFSGYLWKNAQGRKTYATLAEATEVAATMEDALGVTKSKGKYSVRKGEGGVPYPCKAGSVSWMKADAAAAYADHTQQVAKAFSQSPSQEHIEPEPEPEPEDNHQAAYDDETENDEPEFDPEAEEEDEEASVIRWTFEGVDYLVNESDGAVYDAQKYEEEQEVVQIGTREPNTSEGKLVTE